MCVYIFCRYTIFRTSLKTMYSKKEECDFDLCFGGNFVVLSSDSHTKSRKICIGLLFNSNTIYLILLHFIQCVQGKHPPHKYIDHCHHHLLRIKLFEKKKHGLSCWCFDSECIHWVIGATMCRNANQKIKKESK